jgi:hypothetical protein
MANYRIFMLDRSGGVVTASDTVCHNDEAALAWAATTLGPDARAEIWQGSRCLGRVSSVSVPLDQGQEDAAEAD